jgi:hypothetical protein
MMGSSVEIEMVSIKYCSKFMIMGEMWEYLINI